MKRLFLLATSILLFSCSKPDAQTNTGGSVPIDQQDEIKNYNNMVFLDATYERINANGDQLPVSITDAVTIFDKTTDVKITPTTFETNLIDPSTYFKNGSTYSLPNSVQFSIYENSNIIIKKIEYSTSYGKDKRSERYSY